MADRYTRPYFGVWIDNEWQDKTTDVYGLDGKSGIPIARGNKDETSRLTPASSTLTMRNFDYTWYPRHPQSPFYGALLKNTPVRMGIDYHTMTFGTTVSNSWGSTDTVRGVAGIAWEYEGTQSDFDVAAGVGTIANPGSTRRSALLGSYGDAEVLMRFSVNSIANTPEIGFVFHYTDSSNFSQVFIRTSDNTLRMRRTTAGSGTLYHSGSFTIAAGTNYWMRASLGRVMRFKVWSGNLADETVGWDHETFDYDPFNQGFIPRSGGVGPFINLTGAGSATLTVDNFEVFHPTGAMEISRFSPSANNNSRNQFAELQCAGVFQRLSVGNNVLSSPIYAEVTKEETASYAVAYWPGEDESGTIRPASALGGEPMRVLGEAPDFGSTSVIPGTPRMIRLNAGGLSANLPTSPSTAGNIFFRFIIDIPDDSFAAYPVDMVTLYLSGTAERAVLRWTALNTFSLLLLDSSGATVASDVGNSTFMRRSAYWSIEFVQDGADVDWIVAHNVVNEDPLSMSNFLWSGTFAGLTIGRATAIVIGVNNDMEGCAVGHIAMGSNQDFFFSSDAIIGYAGETAGVRLARLCSENDVDFYFMGVNDLTDPVGPQTTDTLVANLQLAADTDQGVLFEPRNTVGVGYRCREDIYRQNATVIDYTDGVLSEQLEPADDDQQLANDVTATAENASSFRVTKRTGANNLQPPPDGVGVYKTSFRVSPYTEDQLADIAYLRLHQGTWDEARYPTVAFNLSRSVIRADDDLRAQLLGLMEGDRLQIQNPPDWLPPDNIDLMVRGSRLVYGQLMATTEFNTTPFGPYIGATAGDGESRVSAGGDMVLATQIDGDDTSLIVQSITGQQYWATTTDDSESASDFPMDILVQGERMTVTASNRGLVDTFTRSVGAGGWDTASDGIHAYTIGSGTPANFSVTGTQGRVAITNLNEENHAITDIGASFNQELRTWCTIPVTPTGAAINWGILLRWQDVNNYYWVDVQVQTTGALTLRIIRRFGGTAAQIASKDITGLVHSTADPRALRARILGSRITARVYDPINNQDTRDWQLEVEDSNISGTSITYAGVVSRRMTGNTNASPVVFNFDNLIAYSPQILTVTRSVNGISKIHTPGKEVEVFNPTYVAR